MNNGYGLNQFLKEDVIIDIGAHIGAFTCACLARGARNIVSFEPDPESYSLAQTNVRRFADSLGVSDALRLYGCAIWRSDRIEHVFLSRAPKSPFSGRLHPAAQSSVCHGPNRILVHALGLDAIVDCFESVSLLKLDCEGAEWPILLTAKRLAKVKRILVELHSLDWKSFELQCPISEQLNEYVRLTPDDLAALLERVGFRCVRWQTKPNLFGNSRYYYGLLEFESGVDRGDMSIESCFD